MFPIEGGLISGGRIGWICQKSRDTRGPLLAQGTQCRPPAELLPRLARVEGDECGANRLRELAQLGGRELAVGPLRRPQVGHRRLPKDVDVALAEFRRRGLMVHEAPSADDEPGIEGEAKVGRVYPCL